MKEEQEPIKTFYGSRRSGMTSTPITAYYNDENEIFIEIGDIELDPLNYECIVLDGETAKLFVESLKIEISYIK